MSHLLDHYQESLLPTVSVVRINLRDLLFDSNLRRGYTADQPWEADLNKLGNALVDCDHVVIGFPLWWGAEPAQLKGLLDRIVLPGFAFKYHRHNVWWDRLMVGRSVDMIVTMDTPPWYLKLVYGDSVMHRWRSQILGFCGFKPIRQYRFGPTRRGKAGKRIERWRERIARAAHSIERLPRGRKLDVSRDHAGFMTAIEDRMS